MLIALALFYMYASTLEASCKRNSSDVLSCNFTTTLLGLPISFVRSLTNITDAKVLPIENESVEGRKPSLVTKQYHVSIEEIYWSDYNSQTRFVEKFQQFARSHDEQIVIQQYAFDVNRSLTTLVYGIIVVFFLFGFFAIIMSQRLSLIFDLSQRRLGVHRQGLSGEKIRHIPFDEILCARVVPYQWDYDCGSASSIHIALKSGEVIPLSRLSHPDFFSRQERLVETINQYLR